MKFSSALVASVLSASAVMAAPGTAARRARHAKRGLGRQSTPMSKANVTDSTLLTKAASKNAEYSTNWAGAVLIGTGYTAVTGTFTIPDVSAGSDSNEFQSASAWVGIDGDTCDTAILQTGVDFNYEDGEVSYDAWYEWYPDYSYDFSGISFSAGDEVKVTVDATSSTSGTATVENLTTGETVSETFENVSDGSLCEYNAEWIVEDYTEVYGNYETLVPLADFGTVTFTDATATTSSGTVTPEDATIIDMVSEEDDLEVECSASSSEVTCTYVA